MRTIFIWFLFALVTSISSNGQTDTTFSNWKTAKFKTATFRYPPDWQFEKFTAPEKVALTATPPPAKPHYLYFFEVMLVNRQGSTFAEIKKDFLGAYRARIDGEVSLVSKKDTTFSGLPALHAKINLFSNFDPHPFDVYLVNGKTLFYLVTTMEFRKEDHIVPELPKTLNAILNSVKLE